MYARALRAQPPRTPRNLARLPAYATAGSPAGDGVLPRAADLLRQRRYRVVAREDSVAAERGYLREAGNLVFHVSLLFLLLGVAFGILFGFRGTSVVIVGQGFANNLTQYDDFTSGARFAERDLVPFGLTVERFDVSFETGAVQTGAARQFRAEVEVVDRPGRGRPVGRCWRSNRPLDIDGTTVHLIGHGYAPVVTVKDGAGNVAFSGPVPFLPQDGNFTSAGAIKVPGRPTGAARLRGLLPAHRRGRPGAVRGRCSRTRSTRRCSPTSGMARPRTRPGGRRTCTPSTPPAWRR